MSPEVESALIAAAATLVGVGGTVIVAIAAVRSARRTNQATIDAAHADAQLTLDAAREAQFADRYSRALEQVGSANVDVRIGGIYALEGIALDSPRYHPTVTEVLAAFIREHSRTPADGTKPTRWPLADVQTALTVVGRRKAEHDIRAINLTGADLGGADLGGTNLTNTELAGADLTGVDLHSANLTGANLSAANLTGANLRSADLHRANLGAANLGAAYLGRADLHGAYLGRADLVNADLHSAGLDGANFDGANLTGAYWPKDVPAPDEWSLDGSGRLIRALQTPDAGLS